MKAKKKKRNIKFKVVLATLLILAAMAFLKIFPKPTQPTEPK